jgi:hypothetical protein
VEVREQQVGVGPAGLAEAHGFGGFAAHLEAGEQFVAQAECLEAAEPVGQRLARHRDAGQPLAGAVAGAQVEAGEPRPADRQVLEDMPDREDASV